MGFDHERYRCAPEACRKSEDESTIVLVIHCVMRRLTLPGRELHCGGDESPLLVFFFSSRRRHTRLQGDWSSDVCSSDLALYFAPIAGYIPDRPAIKYLIAQRDMEVWLAPIAGTRVVVPFRFSTPTPLGLDRKSVV